MIRCSTRLACAAALAVLILPIVQIAAQQQVPAAPPDSAAAPAQDATQAPAQDASQAPSAPTPSAPTPSAPVFPPPDPANFTASSPSKDTINDFLQTSWGYDSDRIWQVQAILKTQVEGISKVIVLVGDKSGKQKAAGLQFLALADGKHIIAQEEILPFGEHPYAHDRAALQEKADGPYRGSASKDLELVEFADFQCPHCKDAQANMDKLAVDFPKARIVFQNFPLTQVHPQAFNAASYGVCVSKLGGSSAFFQFASAVFDGQDGLASTDGATLTLNSAVTKAGLEPAKVAACVATPTVAEQVRASIKLAAELNINQTPTLMINGRQLALGGMPYETIKKIVDFQAKLDGVQQ